MTYLVWGVYHGLGIAAHRLFQRRVLARLKPSTGVVGFFGRLVSWTVTINFIVIGFILTKEDSIKYSFNAFKHLVT